MDSLGTDTCGHPSSIRHCTENLWNWLGAAYQDWEIGYAMRSSRNTSIVSSPDVARTQSSPLEKAS